MAPAIVKLCLASTTKPVNPEREAPLLRVTVFAPVLLVKVRVPLPDNVPLRSILFLFKATVGFAPKGRLQSLLTITVTLLVVPVFMVTVLKVTLLQERVVLTEELSESNVTVPELWVKVGVPEMVKSLATLVVLEEATKVPADKVKEPFISIAASSPEKVPSAWI